MSSYFANKRECELLTTSQAKEKNLLVDNVDDAVM
jgi:hypothetical protein